MNENNSQDDNNKQDRTMTSGLEETSANRKIDRYTLLKQVGEGGMGEVWLAEQTEPFKRRVALKIIKPGMDTRQVVARFEAERQALALMEHPSVAKIFDAGTTPEGRPYFVMEYVSGLKLTDYCDRHQLTINERLRLFKKVCDGVQHAHQKTIVHRDLKPSNILVTEQNGEAVPKIIDFGLAKATAQSLTDKTMVTHFGTLLGTPEYMSPEQAENQTEDIDTRTDIYSLGVVLYHILTGKLPFDSDELRKGGLDGIRDQIKNRQPLRPSKCIGSLGEASLDTAKLRQSTVKTLYSELTGDLDWIVMKCLEKDRNRRYSSVAALAEDIERYLTSKPVTARPPSKIYELKRFTRRHRVAVFASLLVFTALSAEGIFATYGFFKASRAQSQAEAEAVKADKVSQFLISMLQDANFFETNSRAITLEDVIAKALPRIETELEGELNVQASLRNEFGVLFYSYGDFETAEQLYRQSIDDYEKYYGGVNEYSEFVRDNLSWLLQKSKKFDETISMAMLGAENCRKLFGEKSEELAGFLDLIGDTYRFKDDLENAEKYMLQSCRMFEDVTGEVPARIQNDLALVYQRIGKLEEAETIFRKIYKENLDKYGESQQHTHLYMDNLASTLWLQGKLHEASEWFRKTLEVRTKYLGADHPFTQHTRDELNDVLAEIKAADSSSR